VANYPRPGPDFKWHETDLPNLGEIITKGRIWSPPPGGGILWEKPPFSIAVVGLDLPSAGQLARQLRLRPGLDFKLGVLCDLSFALAPFTEAYVDLELAPGMRHPEEDEWFQRFEQKLRGPVYYVELEPST
jgi:hypothetical protein